MNHLGIIINHSLTVSVTFILNLHNEMLSTYIAKIALKLKSCVNTLLC